MSRITKRTVDALKPGEIAWDGNLPGFGVRRRDGESRIYFLKYRGPDDGLQHWLRLGRHGEAFTAEQARKKAKRLLGEIAHDQDPAVKPEPAPTFKAFAERYLRDHAQAHKRPSSAAEDKRNLANHLIPAFGHLRLDEITRARVVRFHLGMKDMPTAANRCLALISTMLVLAERWGVLPDGTANPCRVVQKYREAKRERMLSAVELAAIGEALAASDQGASATAAIRLLLLTGARRNEILTAKWEHVDFENGYLRLPESKTGRKAIPLNAPALAVLDAIPRISGNPFVITGRREHGHLADGRERGFLTDLERPWFAIRERAAVALWRASDDPAIADLVAGLTAELGREPTAAECVARAEHEKIALTTALLATRLHDLRHAYASIGASSGMGLPLIGAILGHRQASTTQRYSHVAPDPARAAAEAIGSKIAAAMGDGNKGAPANVVPLASAKS